MSDDPATPPPRRRLLDGTGAFTPLAIACLILSGLFLFAALWGPSNLQWTGKRAPGTLRDGVIHYQYQGHDYILDDPTSSTFHETTVFFDPSDPTNAMLDNPFDRALDVSSVIGPLVLAVVFLGFGLRRRRRRLKTEKALADSPTGRPLDKDLVEWLRERQRYGI